MELERFTRIAEAKDARPLARLVNLAGEGLPLHIWSTMAAPDQDPWEVGRRRQAEKAQEGQIYVVDFGEGPVASLTGYAIGPTPEPIGAALPALFRPLQELENLALNSWYVNVLACFPETQGQGIGTHLLTLAEKIAADRGISRMSVIVSDDNHGARRLYERVGYAEKARRRCVSDGWQTGIQNWVLLTKEL